jgi:hypothetical protein
MTQTMIAIVLVTTMIVKIIVIDNCNRLRTPTPPPPEDAPTGVEGADSDAEVVRDTYKMPPPVPLPEDSKRKLRVPSPVPQPKDDCGTDQVSSNDCLQR